MFLLDGWRKLMPDAVLSWLFCENRTLNAPQAPLESTTLPDMANVGRRCSRTSMPATSAPLSAIGSPSASVVADG